MPGFILHPYNDYCGHEACNIHPYKMTEWGLDVASRTSALVQQPRLMLKYIHGWGGNIHVLNMREREREREIERERERYG